MSIIIWSVVIYCGYSVVGVGVCHWVLAFVDLRVVVVGDPSEPPFLHLLVDAVEFPGVVVRFVSACFAGLFPWPFFFGYCAQGSAGLSALPHLSLIHISEPT